MADHRDDDRLEAELVLLVDGQLETERAAVLEARADLAARIALLRAGRDHLRAAAASVEAPIDLRRRVDALATPPSRQRRRWVPLAALAGVGAAAAVALVLATAGGATSATCSDETGRSPAAGSRRRGGPLLPVAVDGVRFPDYEQKFGWRAVGRRADEIDGRHVTTVFYEAGPRPGQLFDRGRRRSPRAGWRGHQGRGHAPGPRRRRQRRHVEARGPDLRDGRLVRRQRQGRRRAGGLEGEGQGRVLAAEGLRDALSTP